MENKIGDRFVCFKLGWEHMFDVSVLSGGSWVVGAAIIWVDV